MLYTENDIRRLVGVSAFEKGRKYQLQGRVSSFHSESGGAETKILARVRGSAGRAYEQKIGVKANGSLRISSRCSCPVGVDCKHVAAVLLELLPRLTAPQSAAAPARSKSVPPAAPALPPDLAAWLGELERARETAGEDYPANISQRLVYVLSRETGTRHSPRLRVRIVSTRALKDGSFSQTNASYNPSSAFSPNPAKFLRPSDLRILRSLANAHREAGYQPELQLAGETGWEILREVLATGRARWLDVNGPALALGPAREGKIVWTLSDDAMMRPDVETPEDLVAAAGAPPIYIDAAAGVAGPIETGLPPKVAGALLDAPPVPAEHVASLARAMETRAPETAAARPAPPAPAIRISDAPTPLLRLIRADLPTDFSYSAYRASTEPVGLARLVFRYGPAEVAHGERSDKLTRVRGGQLIEIRRDARAETAALALLEAQGFSSAPQWRLYVPPAHVHDFLPGADEADWFEALDRKLPKLRAHGFAVEIADDFPLRLVNGGDFNATLSETSGVDWLELDLGVNVDGETIDLSEPLVELIASPHFDLAALERRAEKDEPCYVRLSDGRFLALSMARLAPILAAIYELACGGALADGKGRLRLTRGDAVSLAAFETATASAGLVWRGGEQLREMGRKLAASGGVPEAPPPASFNARLRPYQAQGVAWLAFLREVGLGGVLADDMGLGKTVQALALIAIEKAAARLDLPALVIAPTSLMANWRCEAEKFAPDLRVLVLHGLDRKNRFDEIETSDVVLTTYPLIARDHGVIGKRKWHMLILDEAQTIKNPDAATTKLVGAIEARHRFCLTGTPLENHLGELWSLFSFVSPGFLGDRRFFTQSFRTPIEKKGDRERGRLLAKRVKPFLLRRTKEEVASELPPKTEIVERVEMERAQRDIYESIRLSMHDRVRQAIAEKGFARSRIVILDALLKMRQVCCDPRLLKLKTKAAAKAGSAKLERLEELLAELADEGRRILVFSQFTSMLELVRPRLDAMKLPYSLLTGETREREKEIRAFQDGKTKAFLVSLKAGGVGLNLTAADTVILYDPWWNPAVEEQAVDRAHRIGQDKPVFVHKLVTAGTIEEKMETLKEKKRALAESIFDHEGEPTLAMTEADIDMLFSEA